MHDSAYLAVALNAARAAGELIRGYYRRNPVVKLKADATPVTEADVAAEKLIREMISAACPGHGFYGEETGRERDDAEYVWLVDPIDGTRSFVRGYPFFSTQIALMRNDHVELGVSSAPLFGEVAWAERGAGAWLNGERCAVSRIDALGACTLSTGNLKSMATSDAWLGYGALVARADRSRGYGDFYHYHLLASGRIDIVIESDVQILDIAALSLIVEEAGGRFTDLGGRPLDMHTRSVLATNGLLHEPVLEMLDSGM
ncbi:MAG: inositol monophosphatase family protein [Gammaproteobacteria bacterium]